MCNLTEIDFTRDYKNKVLSVSTEETWCFALFRYDINTFFSKAIMYNSLVSLLVKKIKMKLKRGLLNKN